MFAIFIPPWIFTPLTVFIAYFVYPYIANVIPNGNRKTFITMSYSIWLGILSVLLLLITFVFTPGNHP